MVKRMVQIARTANPKAFPKTDRAGVFGKATNPVKRAVLYARVSTKNGDQDPEVQLAQLREWAEQRGWFVVAEESDRVSGDPGRRKGEPPGLRSAMEMVARREVDVLAVFSADRLVRSPVHLLQLIGRVQADGGHVASMQDGADLDTTSDVGELMVFIRGWWARMEMKLIRKRIKAGLERARAIGKTLGRPRVDGADAAIVAKLRKQGKSWSEISGELGVPMSTVRRRAFEADSTPTKKKPTTKRRSK